MTKSKEETLAYINRYRASVGLPPLTAAAKVGDLPSVNWKDGKPFSYCPECGRDDRFLDAATIERCAQVAESFAEFDKFGVRYKIAAAIRALKDEPPRERTVIGIEWDKP